MQAKTAEQDSPVATRFSCASCQITYYGEKNKKPQCPLCRSEQLVADLRRSLMEANGRIEHLENQQRVLAQQVDTVTAMRGALEITGAEDLVFLKTVAYRWRQDRSVNLKVTHGKAARRGEAPPANGFVSVPRNGEPEGHVCSSLGGVAMAGYIDESLHTVGSAQTMTLLIRAMNKYLTGAME